MSEKHLMYFVTLAHLGNLSKKKKEKGTTTDECDQAVLIAVPPYWQGRLATSAKRCESKERERERERESREAPGRKQVGEAEATMTDFNKSDEHDVKEKTRTYVDVGRRCRNTSDNVGKGRDTRSRREGVKEVSSWM